MQSGYFFRSSRMAVLTLGCMLSQAQQTTNNQSTPDASAARAAQSEANAKLSADQSAAKAVDAKNASDASARSAENSAASQKAAADAAQNASGSEKRAAVSADKSRESAENSAKSADSASKSAQKANAGGILQRLAQRKGAPRKAPLSDYVPCMFAGDEDFELRSRPNPFRKSTDPLTQEEAEKVAAITINQWKAKHSLPDSVDPEAFKQEIVNEIVGLTPDEAAKRIQDLYAEKIKTAATPIVNKSKTRHELADQLSGFRWFSSTLKATIEKDQPDKPLSAAEKAQLPGQVGEKQAQKSDVPASAVKQVTAPLTFNRPDDVSCSFSLMGWHETSDVFGRRVANDYVAIQVNVRNLSHDNEFLIHDIQLAVDTGVNPRQLGRFQTGRDRIIVRSVAQRGQSEDRRNLILNTMQMIGNIAGGASAAFTQATVDDKDTTPATKLSTAVALFQGPFITGLTNIFPDHTIEHINHISDLAFSASSTNKTVVPVQGAVPLVTFLLEKPLEQLPFSRCGTTIERTFRRDRIDIRYKEEAKKNGQPDDATNANDPGHIKYKFCQLEPDDDEASTDDPEPRLYTKPLHYKKWHAAALQVLERRVYVVIAGVHIQEVSNAPAINSVKCPIAGPENGVDLSQADKNGNIACNLDGKHLDKAASARLAFNSKSVSASVSAASDGNSGTLSFKADDVKGKDAAGDYKVFVKDNGGNETDTKQSIKIGIRSPNLTSVAPKFTKGQPAQLTLIGNNLDRIDKVNLVNNTDPNNVKTAASTIQNQDSINSQTATINVTVSQDELTKLGTPPLTALIQLVTKDGDTLQPISTFPIQVPKQ